MEDLNDMLYFAEVVDKGSFAAAGRALGLPKSRLSRRVAELEGRLGVRLLQRTTRKLSVTAVGELYHRHCAAIRDEAQAAAQAVAQVQTEPRGIIRIACPVTLAHSTIGPIVPLFMARYPQVRVDVRVSNRVVDLVEEGFDLALRVRPSLDDSGSMVVKNFGISRTLLVCRPEQLTRQGIPNRPEDLQRLDTVAMSSIDGRASWQLLGPDGASYSLTHQPRCVADDMLTLHNTGRIDGSPHVIDAFGDFTASGQRGWHTILMVQTGSGDTTANDRKPGVYALDISDPANPIVLWEYSMANTAARATFEIGTGLTLAAGAVQNGVATKWMVYAQTNNGGTAGSGDVVTGINIETGLAEWQTSYAFTTSLRSGASIPSGTGIPGGVVAIDTKLQGYLTDVAWGTLYGDVWRADPATGISKDGVTKPLFRFSTDNHPIGAKPAIFVKGGVQYAIISTGGYVDTYPSDTTWSPPGTAQYIMAVSLNTPIADATINENKGAPDILFKYAYGANEKGIAQATVIGNQIYVTTDTADTNDNTNPGAYGTGGASGHVYAINVASTPSIGTSVLVEGGVSSVINSGTGVYSGAADQQSRLVTDANAASVAAAAVDSASTTSVKRRLWIRTQ